MKNLNKYLVSFLIEGKIEKIEVLATDYADAVKNIPDWMEIIKLEKSL